MTKNVRIIILFIAIVITGYGALTHTHSNLWTENNKINEIEKDYFSQDTIKSLRETYPDYFTREIDTSYQVKCIANLASIRVIEKCRQSYIFLFNIISDISDTTILNKKEVHVELWADYDAYYLMKYMGITDFGDGYNNSTDARDYIPSKVIKLNLILHPIQRDEYFILLDAILIK